MDNLETGNGRTTMHDEPIIDYTDPRWRFDERVKNLMNRGRTKEEAENIVKTVILTKEQ